MAKTTKGRSKGAGTLILRGRTWFARWTVAGRVYTRTTGEGDKRKAESKLSEYTKPFLLGDRLETVKALAVKTEGIEREIEEWRDGQPSMTMLQAWGAFKVAPKGKTPRGRVIMPGARTLADYEGRWNAFCTWMDKTYPKLDDLGVRIPWELRQIGKEHAQRYIAEIGAGKSANTRNKSLTFLRLVFKVLADDARIKANPFDGMDAAPLAVTRKRPLTMTELGTISKNLIGKGEMEILFSIGYYTGARLGDCVLLRWDNIDMGARKIRYTPHKTAKSNMEITLTVSPTLFGLLDRTPGDERKGLVLPELGELYRKDPAAVSKRIQQVFIDAGIETDLEVEGYGKRVARVGFHSLRHAHITAMIEAGVPLDVVQRQAGHSTIGMTAHYHAISEKALQAASDAIPSITQARALPELADATQAGFDAILNGLEKLNAEQLKSVVARAQGLIGGLDKTEVNK